MGRLGIKFVRVALKVVLYLNARLEAFVAQVNSLFAFAVISFAFSVSSLASESVDVLCKKSPECGQLVVSTLSRMGCAPIAESLNCNISINTGSEPKHDLCRVKTANCTEPKPDLIFTTHCQSGTATSFKNFDPGLTLGWWMGLGGSYISYVCID